MKQQAALLLFGRGGFAIQRGNTLAEGTDALLGFSGVFPASTAGSNFFAQAVPLGLGRLCGSLGSAPAGVAFEDGGHCLSRIEIASTGGKSVHNGGGIFPQESDVQHRRRLIEEKSWVAKGFSFVWKQIVERR